MSKKHPANRQNTAVALRYNKDQDRSPRLVAKGRGAVAEQIRRVALENGIPVHQDNDLVELLSQVDIDREIPPELYTAVAEILSWVYRANESLRKELM